MSYLGMGVMIGMLSGNEESVEAIKSSLGKKIKLVELKYDDLHITFDNDETLVLSDQGQSCCEHRYMTTDDELSYYTGAKLLDISIKDGPSAEVEYGDHDVQFLEIKTSKGVFTMESHNEHNGYYGGFHIVALLRDYSND